MKRLRLLSVISSAEVGGAEKHIEFIIRYLPAEHIVVALADGPMIERYRQCGAETIILPSEGKMPLKAISPFRNIVRRYAPDIVHTHTPKANLLGAISRLKVTRVMTIHGSHRQFAHSRLLPSAWYKWADMWAANNADRVIAVCESDARELSNSGFNRTKIVVVRNGVPDIENNFSRIHEDARDIVWIGRFSEEKAPMDMIEIAEMISGHPELGRIRMIGNGPLLDEVRLLKSGKIELEPPKESLAEVWKKSAVLVNTSRSEGASLTIIEALAHGVPVIASNAGGNPEIVGDAGTIIPLERREEERTALFASAIKRIFEENNYSIELSQRARQRYEENFRIEKMVESLQEVYRNADAPVVQVRSISAGSSSAGSSSTGSSSAGNSSAGSSSAGNSSAGNSSAGSSSAGSEHCGV